MDFQLVKLAYTLHLDHGKMKNMITHFNYLLLGLLLGIAGMLFWATVSLAQPAPVIPVATPPPPAKSPTTLSPPVTLNEVEKEEIIPASPRTSGVGFHWSLIKFKGFSPGPGLKYSDVYGRAGPLLSISNDYYLIQSPYGNLTTGWTLGVFFDHGDINHVNSMTLMGVPFMAGLTYRGEIVNRQLWIPFARLEGGGWYYRQKSADGTQNRTGFQPAVSLGAGTDLLLDFFLWDYSKFMDRHFGINWTTITGEIKYVYDSKGGPSDLSHWRFDIGVRFEL